MLLWYELELLFVLIVRSCVKFKEFWVQFYQCKGEICLCGACRPTMEEPKPGTHFFPFPVHLGQHKVF